MTTKPLTLQPTSSRRELILLYGKDKVGKSTSWLETALYTTSSFYVLDTDDTFEASIDDFPQLDKSRFTIAESESWTQTKSKVLKLVSSLQPNDFLVIDRIDVPRDQVRDHFIEEIFGRGASEWIIDTLQTKREEGKKGSVNTELPWSNINATYYSWVNYLRRQCKKKQAHLFICAGAKSLIDSGMMADKPDTLAMYGDVGYKPAGGNDIGYIPHSILYMNKSPSGVRRLTTIGDRGRKDRFLRAEEMPEEGAFPLSYLIPAAGWRPVKV